MTGNRTAVVIGGSRGIGRAVVELLARRTWSVVATGRDADVLAELERELSADGVPVRIAVVDATDQEATERLARDHGDADLLVYNAGASSAAPLRRTSLENWNAQVEVNATGAFLAMRAFVPLMQQRGRGRVVVVASTAGLSGQPYISAYTAAKHAVVGLVRSVAAEVAGSGVTVNAVCPHFVRTAMTDRTIRRIQDATGRSVDEARQELEQRSRLGRLIEPGEVAAAVEYLASPAAEAVNGHTLVLDGGGHW